MMIRPKECFGESEIISKYTRCYSAYCLEDTELFALDAKAFLDAYQVKNCF